MSTKLPPLPEPDINTASHIGQRIVGYTEKTVKRLRLEAVEADRAERQGEADEQYDKIDRHLRNTLDDDDYSEMSAALDILCTGPAQQQGEAVPDAIAAAIKHAAAVLESDAGPQARKATADGIRGVLKEHRHPAEPVAPMQVVARLGFKLALDDDLRQRADKLASALRGSRVNYDVEQAAAAVIWEMRDALAAQGEAVDHEPWNEPQVSLASVAHPAAPAQQEPPVMTPDKMRELVKECGLDWHRGFMPLFPGDDTNRYAVLIEAVLALEQPAQQPLSVEQEREAFEVWVKDWDRSNPSRIRVFSDTLGVDYPLGRMMLVAWQARAAHKIGGEKPEPPNGWSAERHAKYMKDVAAAPLQTK